MFKSKQKTIANYFSFTPKSRFCFWIKIVSQQILKLSFSLLCLIKTLTICRIQHPLKMKFVYKLSHLVLLTNNIMILTLISQKITNGGFSHNIIRHYTFLGHYHPNEPTYIHPNIIHFTYPEYFKCLYRNQITICVMGGRLLCVCVCVCVCVWIVLHCWGFSSALKRTALRG